MNNIAVIEEYLNNQRDHNRIIEEVNRSDYRPRSMDAFLRKYIDNFLSGNTVERWIVMPGLRGVGKTTLLSQAYTYTYEKYVRDKSDFKKANIIYFSLDIIRNLGGNLLQSLYSYESLMSNRLENITNPVLFFIDEVQVDPNWARVLKTVYDRTSNVFIICTGSAATYLQMDADTAGRRATIQRLYPLTFSEYQLFFHNKPPLKDVRKKLYQTCYWSSSAKEVYKNLKKIKPDLDLIWSRYDINQIEDYMKLGNMPFAWGRSQSDTYKTVRLNIEKVINDDLSSDRRFHFSHETINKIKMLPTALANSSSTPSLSTLSDLLEIDNKNILELLRALVLAEVLIRVPAYGNYKNANRKPVRYQFMSSAIRCAYWDIIGNRATARNRRGQLLEDMAALHYYREFTIQTSGELNYVYDKKGKGQCDFILKLADSHQIALEFGLGEKSFKQVEVTMKEVDCDYGLVFANSPLSINATNKAVIIPLKYFFLM